MTQEQVLANAAEIILTVIFWVSLLFPVIVGTFWKWWKTDFGNSYVWKVILLAIVSSGTAVHEMFGISTGALWFRWFVTAGLALIPAVLAWRGMVLWREQRAEKSKNPLTAIRDWAHDRKAASQPGISAGHQENCGSNCM